MKPPLEKTIRQTIRRHLEGMGAVVLTQNHMNGAGVPDLIVCLPGGRLAAFEVKRPGQYPTKLQLRWLDRFEKAGAIAAVVRSVSDVEAEIERANR